MARINGRINDESDKEMRHEAIDLGLRYPGEFIEFLWEEFKRLKQEE